MFKFEYDPHKSQSNVKKHGMDFVEAQQLWQDEDLLEIPTKTETEPKWIVIAKLKQKHKTETLDCRNYLSRRYCTHYFSP
ncbi:BrnT family toxin [Cyanobacterium aponinum]|uniref:BrnT family toxin n=1 Tax=Cyanobacterium aponinum TaxID=379064 RepID=UPI001F4E3201|nr:BrnT family toxin [Cyanobacterium aponinum]